MLWNFFILKVHHEKNSRFSKFEVRTLRNELILSSYQDLTIKSSNRSSTSGWYFRHRWPIFMGHSGPVRYPHSDRTHVFSKPPISFSETWLVLGINFSLQIHGTLNHCWKKRFSSKNIHISINIEFSDETACLNDMLKYLFAVDPQNRSRLSGYSCHGWSLSAKWTQSRADVEEFWLKDIFKSFALFLYSILTSTYAEE